MTTDRWVRVKELFHEALACTPERRPAFLEATCAEDGELRAEIERLLTAHEQAGSFIEHPPVPAPTPPPPRPSYEPIGGVPDSRTTVVATASPRPPYEPMTGRVVGHYQVGRLIGAGGMGEVYEARDTALGRTVAIKVVASADADGQRRLRREAQHASQLNHPHICTIHDVGDVDGRAYIVMEYVEGQLLADAIPRNGLPPDVALTYAIQITDALAHAHEHGIIHRDLKSSNVMITRGHWIKVLDFGLAKCLTPGALSGALQSRSSIRDLGVIAGTLPYMAPEVLRGQPADHGTDIWSFGVLLYEMLTGDLPFAGATAFEISSAILHERPRPLPASVPTGLGAKLLAKDRDDRYQSMAELTRELRALQRALERPEELVGRTTTLATDVSAAPGARFHNLPTQPTALIGRDAEIDAIRQLLRGGQTRLVVLTGPGGCGKTHLAIEGAFRLATQYRDGVCFVALAQVMDPALVASAVAQALGLKETALAPVQRVLEQHLRERQLLLVLDNFEQVLAAASLVAALLAACPGLHCLMTSRAALRVRGEQELPILPLALPNLTRLPPVDALGRLASVRLFVERARAVRPDFVLAPENAAAVAEICARLDGLPLALELAAARVKLLSPQDMLGRLARRLPLLTGGARDLPARQQTLGDAIAWSYNLLDPSEQALFGRLSVFAGGFTLDAAASICGDEESAVLEAVESLLSKSLLRRRETPEGRSRFSMLDTIREFAAESLSDRGEAAPVQARHAQFFLALAEAAEPELITASRGAWLDRLETEHDNLRAAIEWAVRTGAAEIALRLGAALWRFWEARGSLAEASDRLDRILAMPEPAESRRLRLRVLYASGVIADAAGNYTRGRARFGECLAMYRELGDPWGIANSLNNLGILALRQLDYATARGLYEESLSIWRKIGNTHAAALSLSNLGNVANLQKDHQTARTFHEESLAIFRELGDEPGIAWSLNHLGDVRRDEGEYDAARELHEQALGIFRSLRHAPGIASCLTDLGHLAGDRGDAAPARAMYEEALAIFGELGDGKGVARVLEGFALLAGGQGETARALRLAGAAAALRESIGMPLSPAEQARLEVQLGPIDQRSAVPERRRWLVEGRAMPVERAIECALSGVP